jgi:hypothetical protein
MTMFNRLSLNAAVAAVAIAFSAASFAQPPSHSDADLGWTGQTTVLGSSSSIADTASSTREHQVGQY